MTDYNPNDSKWAELISPYIRLSKGASTAALHFCAIDLSGAVRCWGQGGKGQLGAGSSSNSADGALVNLGTGRTAKSIATATNSTCALLDDGTVKCWGAAASMQLGNNATSPDVNTPGTALTFGSAKATQIAASSETYFVLLDNKTIGYWGNEGGGAVGNEAGNGWANPPEFGIDLGTDRYATQISAGRSHACALLDNASIKCWGYNTSGQLGICSPGDALCNGVLTNSNPKNKIGDATGEMGDALPSVYLGGPAKAVSAGRFFTCALLDNSSVRCWGYNTSGELGNGTVQAKIWGSPSELGDNASTIVNFGGKKAKSIHAGYAQACAILEDDSAMCWGAGDRGQLGQGGSNTNTNPTPVAVAFPSGSVVKSIEGGERTTCATLDNSTNNVYCWGTGNAQSSGNACSPTNTPCATAVVW